jgi:hypothetical protein
MNRPSSSAPEARNAIVGQREGQAQRAGPALLGVAVGDQRDADGEQQPGAGALGHPERHQRRQARRQRRPDLVAVNRTHPNTNARRRPTISPTRPATMNSAPRLSMYPLRVHWADSGEAEKERAMSGSASVRAKKSS